MPLFYKTIFLREPRRLVSIHSILEDHSQRQQSVIKWLLRKEEKTVNKEIERDKKEKEVEMKIRKLEAADKKKKELDKKKSKKGTSSMRLSYL